MKHSSHGPWVVHAVVVLLVVCLRPAALSDSPDQLELSLAAAIERARAENPTLLIRRAQRARAEAVRLGTRQGLWPTVSAEAAYLRADSSLLDDLPVLEPGLPPAVVRRDLGPIDGNVAWVQVLQPLINVSAWHARRQAGRQVEAARLGQDRAEDEVTLAVIEAYYGASTATRQVDAERRGRRTAERALRQVQGLFDEQLAPSVDVLRARTRVLEMEARVAAAEREVVLAQTLLRQILGIEGAPRLLLTNAVPEPPAELPELPVAPEQVRERRDLRALEAAVEASEHGVRRARAAYFPDIALLGRYQRIDGNDPLDFDATGWVVGVTLRWTPFAGFGQAGALGEAQAMEAEARAELQALRRRALAEAETALADWRAELLGWERASSAVDTAEEALQLTEARHAEGLTDMTSLLQAQAEEVAARTRETSARFNALVAAERYHLAIETDEPR